MIGKLVGKLVGGGGEGGKRGGGGRGMRKPSVRQFFLRDILSNGRGWGGRGWGGGASSLTQQNLCLGILIA